jgi:hypothetical protein
MGCRFLFVVYVLLAPSAESNFTRWQKVHSWEVCGELFLRDRRQEKMFIKRDYWADGTPLHCNAFKLRAFRLWIGQTDRFHQLSDSCRHIGWDGSESFTAWALKEPF